MYKKNIPYFFVYSTLILLWKSNLPILVNEYKINIILPLKSRKTCLGHKVIKVNKNIKKVVKDYGAKMFRN